MWDCIRKALGQYSDADLQTYLKKISCLFYDSNILPYYEEYTHEYEFLWKLSYCFEAIQDVATYFPYRNLSELISGLCRNEMYSDVYYEDIDVRAITGVAASKGRYTTNLKRLSQTIYDPGNLRLDWNKYDREERVSMLLKQVWREIGNVSDGRMKVFKELWSGRYIVSNTGAARRLSLLHLNALEGEVIIPCHVIDVQLCDNALEALMLHFWCVALPEPIFQKTTRILSEKFFEGIAASKMCGFEDENSKFVKWGMLLVPREHKNYQDIRLAIEDSVTPQFDVSHFLKRLKHRQNNERS